MHMIERHELIFSQLSSEFSDLLLALESDPHAVKVCSLSVLHLALVQFSLVPQAHVRKFRSTYDFLNQEHRSLIRFVSSFVFILFIIIIVVLFLLACFFSHVQTVAAVARRDVSMLERGEIAEEAGCGSRTWCR